jgi:hypothetical protein
MKKLMAIMTAVVLAAASCARGQENDPSVPPDNVDKPPAKQPVLEYALAGGFLLAALAIGFMPSRRSKDE